MNNLLVLYFLVLKRENNKCRSNLVLNFQLHIYILSEFFIFMKFLKNEYILVAFLLFKSYIHIQKGYSLKI